MTCAEVRLRPRDSAFLHASSSKDPRDSFHTVGSWVTARKASPLTNGPYWGKRQIVIGDTSPVHVVAHSARLEGSVQVRLLRFEYRNP